MNRRLLTIYICVILTVITLYIVFLYSPSQDTNIQDNETLEIEWDKISGGTNLDKGSFVLLTDDVGCLVTGYTKSYGAGEEDIWLIKVDENGEEIWNKTYGGKGSETGKAIETMGDNDYVIIGKTNSYGSGEDDAWLIKVNRTGEEKWNNSLGGTGWDEGNAIKKTIDGGYIIAGSTTSYKSKGTDAWLIKVNQTGKEEWNRTYGGIEYDEGRSVIQTDDGGYVIAGSTESYGHGGSDTWLIKVDQSGNEEWNTTFGSELYDICNQVIKTVDDGFIIVGHAETDGGDGWNGIVIKTDSEGIKQWESIVDMDDEITGISSVDKCDDGYIVVGYIGAGGDGQDCLVAKIGLSGDIVWKRSIGREYGDAGVWIQGYGDNCYFITGYWDYLGIGKYDLWLLKIEIN